MAGGAAILAVVALGSCAAQPPAPTATGEASPSVASSIRTGVTGAPSRTTSRETSVVGERRPERTAPAGATTPTTTTPATETTGMTGGGLPPSEQTRSPAPTSSTTITETKERITTAAAHGPTGPPVLLVLDIFAHDPDAFTQGLVFRDGLLYESTGLYGRSSVRIVDPATGHVLASAALDSRYFGEGLEVVGDRIVQLTWKEETAFIWDARTLELLGTYTYDGEGWGLCAFDDRFVMSNGSSRLTFRNLDTFEAIGQVEVLLGGEPVDDLNELECVGDLVYANVWFSDELVVIDPDTGQVISRVDGTPLRQRLSSTDGIDVLNGIAYDPEREVFYLTGKLWPDIFEVRIGAVP